MLSLLLLFLYAVIVSLGAVAGTCTQGDDSRFFLSLVYGLPVFFLAFLSIYLSHTRVLISWIIAVKTLVLVIVISYFWGPLFLATSIKGVHLCGVEFTPDNGSNLYARLIPVVHLLLGIILMLLSINNLTGNKR